MTATAGRRSGSIFAPTATREAFVDRHILPMAAAIWSTPSAEVMAFPAASFVRFFDNHGLLQARNQPIWRTVVGGSREYVRRMLDTMHGAGRCSARRRDRDRARAQPA